tara:strand:+ start:3453 stop:3920 length:468 start_codon:yes stop_codon:yes gene_type:complete
MCLSESRINHHKATVPIMVWKIFLQGPMKLDFRSDWSSMRSKETLYLPFKGATDKSATLTEMLRRKARGNDKGFEYHCFPTEEGLEAYKKIILRNFPGLIDRIRVIQLIIPKGTRYRTGRLVWHVVGGERAIAAERLRMPKIKFGISLKEINEVM